MPFGSMRSRVMMGAVLWTLGLLAVITILLTLSVHAMGTVRIIHSHRHFSAVLAIACMLAGLVLVRSALAPFVAMRRRLADVRQGTERQLQGRYPTEVQPLVDDLNALLAHNQRAVSRATAKAGDLAHGLKTPLAILTNEAGRLAGGGHADLAATISQQVSLMQRQVEYHLAHARTAASGATPGARCVVADSAAGISRTLLTLYVDRGLSIDLSVSPHHAVRVQREDVDEILGNMLDNACKWAKTRVAMTTSGADGWIVINIDDDGAGLEPSMREVVLHRGVRVDEASPGSGFGLAIVRDLAELYGGTIVLEESPLGGLRGTVRLPGY